MRDKMDGLSLDFVATKDPGPEKELFDDALSALVNLGYKKSQAELALKKVYAESVEDNSIESLIKDSLNLLS